MDSKELNEKIKMICDDGSIYDAFGGGGKSIPYIGWFWRNVDFNSKDYHFGVLPVYKSIHESNDIPKLGFMENNKWDYDYCYCPPQDWIEIKSLLEIAVNDPTRENLERVNMKIQSLLKAGDNG